MDGGITLQLIGNHKVVIVPIRTVGTKLKLFLTTGTIVKFIQNSTYPPLDLAVPPYLPGNYLVIVIVVFS